MRIGVDARSVLAKSRRGEGKSLLRLYQEISRIRPGWEVLFYGHPNGLPSGIQNVHDYTFELPGYRFNAWENIGLPLRARLDKVNVLHCAGSSAPRLSPGAPIILTVHDIIPLIFDDGLSKRQVAQFEKQIRYGLSVADMVITISQNTKNDLIRHFGYPSSKIRVVYWGCDTDIKFAGTPASDPAKMLGEPGLNGRYIMAFGGGAPRKNTERIISAFSLSAGSINDLKLVIIGAGNSNVRDHFRSIAHSLNIEARVVILDFIEDAILSLIYKNAELLIYPSLYEGFGLPALEAMAKGVPVVGSKSSSIPEIVGDCAILVDPENEEEMAGAMTKVLADDRLRGNLISRGLERAKLFSWRKTATETVTILEQAVASASTRKV